MVQDYALTFDYAPDMKASKGCSVPVVVYDLDKWDVPFTDPCELLDTMNNHLEKVSVTVKTALGATLDAFTYIVPDAEKDLFLPSKDIFNAMKANYLDNRFDLKYLHDAYKYTAKNMKG